MFIPGDFGRPLPTQQMTKNITNTFLGSSLYPVTTIDSNSMFKIKQEEFQFETPDGVYIPDIVVRVPRTPLLTTDPSTYISVSPFTENNIRKYHSAIGNLNHDNIKNPLSLKDIKAQYKPDQLPLGSGVNPLISDYFKPVHLTPGCLAEIVSFVTEPSPSSSGTNFNNLMGKTTLSNQRNNKMKLWGSVKKNEDIAVAHTSHTDLKLPKSSLTRSSSTFITKVSTTDGLNKKLNAVTELLVAVHGRFLNIINLNDDITKIEIDIPYVRVLFTVGVITTLSTFTSAKNQERNLDIVIGFSSGDLVWINPFKMKYSRLNKNAKLCNKPVTAVSWSPCGRFIYAGFANGEVMMFNRDFDDDESYDMNHNVRKQQYARYFRQYADNVDANPIVHFQTSYKPITSIKFNQITSNVCCVTSDDGYVKLIDICKLSIFEIFPSYYGGLLCAEFTSDGKYLMVGGEDDFISIYEFLSILHPGLGNLRLITRLEGSSSWVRNIQVDYYTSEANMIYKISAVGDDGDLIFWEFQPRDLPKVKIPLHHRTKSSHSPNLKSANSGFFQQQRVSSHRRKISNSIPNSTGNSTTVTRHRHASSISSLTSGQALQQQQHMSILQAMNSHSQVSLLNQNNDIKNLIVPGRRSLSRDPTLNFSTSSSTIVHDVAGLSVVPILKPISIHEINLGRLSGVWFDKKYIWVFTSGGDLVRWKRPQKGKNVSINSFI